MIESYCDGRGFRAYWDGSAWAGEICPGCAHCDPEGTAMHTPPTLDRELPARKPLQSRAGFFSCGPEQNCRLMFPESPEHWCRQCLLLQVERNRAYIRRAASMGDYDY